MAQSLPVANLNIQHQVCNRATSTYWPLCTMGSRLPLNFLKVSQRNAHNRRRGRNSEDSVDACTGTNKINIFMGLLDTD